GVRVQQAAALFRADLETYRAAPEDLRASPLVCVAAAGYEDRKLFDRPRWVPPLSPTGLARAVARNLRGIPEGGSTIPQQIAKLYLRSARRGTVGDKIREALFATCLVRQATPMELAGLYLDRGVGACCLPRISIWSRPSIGSGTASAVRSRASSRAPRCGRPSRPSAPTARCWRGRARSRRSCRSTTDRSPSSRRSIWRSNPSDPSRS